jgi:S-adenosylmethionine:tRNA ribosyltransferase-isomerase
MGMGSALDAYDFPLPTELIAQHPVPQRDASRLMVLSRGQSGCSHHRFADLPGLLPRQSTLVFNNTRVIPARLVGERPGGRPVEVLLIEEAEQGVWRAMARPARRLRPGQELRLAEGNLVARCLERTPEGYWLLAFTEPETFRERLDRWGRIPLPPYISREGTNSEQEHADREAYQTVYASRPGAIAAPTAGLHFTQELLARLDGAGFDRVELTLHVGPGTFAPVQVDDPAQNRMHAEWFEIAPRSAARLREAQTAGRPIIAVGTTAVRSLESWALRGYPPGCSGTTDLFIYPPFRYQAVSGILTNFHLPRSTLLMLVAAFHGRERMLEAYKRAILERYRYFSYGDAMLILPTKENA